jgi:HSP20 family protein
MLPSLTNRRLVNSPIAALWDMGRDMDRLFNGGLESPVERDLPTEVVETEEGLTFRMDVPGLAPENIDVTVENNILTVSGERKWQHQEGQPEGQYYLVERRYGAFQRSFSLPRRVDTSRIQANYEHGVLTLTLPRLEGAKPRRVEITSAGNGKSIEAQAQK